MLDGLANYQRAYAERKGIAPVVIQCSAADLGSVKPFDSGVKADLVVTSPPYPGIHIIYHRWQVDGRRETPAPYWIAACTDGKGGSYYNFADRREQLDHGYFRELAHAFAGVRQVLRPGAIVVQLVAFNEPLRQLRRYLQTLEDAGFEEIRGDRHMGNRLHSRIWRTIPGRSWHASLKGELPSAREVVLIHRAI
jgi:DNA modification methylase